jgi:hypothetical protein
MAPVSGDSRSDPRMYPDPSLCVNKFRHVIPPPERHTGDRCTNSAFNQVKLASISLRGLLSRHLVDLLVGTKLRSTIVSLHLLKMRANG